MSAACTVLIFEIEHPADLNVYAEAIARETPGVQVRCAESMSAALSQAGAAAVLVAKAHNVSAELLRAMPHLQWIQALTTGVDRLLGLPVPAHVRICSARGVHGPQMSELAILLMLALGRDFPRMLDNRRQGRWERWPQPVLTDQTLLIVGLGLIGEMLAQRSRALGMRVIGCSNGRAQVPGFERVAPRAQLAELAAQADFVTVLTPYEPATHQLIDATVLAAMKPSAYLLNLARGPVIDEAALIETLRAGRIAGAALDVFEREPPDPDNPLWTLPNVIMTPHIGGMSTRYAQDLAPLLVANLRAFLAGNDSGLTNLVARQAP
jgi:phosphoglycerate dehydrogenase-like enzyme